MWGRKDEPTPTPEPAPTSQEPAPAPRPIAKPSTPPDSPVAPDAGSPGEARIGKSLKIKGTITGTEDLYIDGRIEGTIRLEQNSLTIGPNGDVDADILAKAIVIEGKVKGNVSAGERISIRKTGSLCGDLFAPRIAIEDGALFRGCVGMVKSTAAPAEKTVVTIPPAAKRPAAEKSLQANGAAVGAPAKK